MGAQPGTEKTLQAKDQNVNQSGNHRGYREGQINESDEQAFADKFELGDGPCRRHSKYKVHGDSDAGGKQGQADGRQGIGFAETGEVGGDSLSESGNKHYRERHEEEESEEDDGNGGERPANPW